MSLRSTLLLLSFGSALACASRVPATTGEATDAGSSTGGDSSLPTGPSMTTADTTTTDTTTTGDPTTTSGEPQPTTRQASVLFVIDNSGSQGEEQILLGEALDAFVAPFSGIDLRVAVTTTDNGNPWCQGTGPEGGAFVASSCRTRLDEFYFPNQSEISQISACETACDETYDAWGGPSDAWYEQRSDGTTNVGSIDFLQALRCGLPQGIVGCGFEQHLESMYKGLARAEDPASAEFGFRYPGGATAVIIITDEADCSHNFDQDTIFLPDGAKTFWSDPSSPSPTSAVCWNAGVQCTGSGTYDTCIAADKGPDGAPTDPESAVLRPVSRYVERARQSEARVYGIMGVPVGYPGTPLEYSEAPAGTPNDPDFEVNFGVGPGCTSTVAEAVPPVRMREVIEQSTSSAEGMYSVCEDDYAPTFAAIAADIIASLPPG